MSNWSTDNLEVRGLLFLKARRKTGKMKQSGTSKGTYTFLFAKSHLPPILKAGWWGLHNQHYHFIPGLTPSDTHLCLSPSMSPKHIEPNFTKQRGNFTWKVGGRS